jgi:hypothetical protein
MPIVQLFTFVIIEIVSKQKTIFLMQRNTTAYSQKLKFVNNFFTVSFKLRQALPFGGLWYLVTKIKLIKFFLYSI